MQAVLGEPDILPPGCDEDGICGSWPLIKHFLVAVRHGGPEATSLDEIAEDSPAPCILVRQLQLVVLELVKIARVAGESCMVQR